MIYRDVAAWLVIVLGRTTTVAYFVRFRASSTRMNYALVTVAHGLAVRSSGGYVRMPVGWWYAFLDERNVDVVA